jgi:two-component system osmolarity sensor histidine kinase EnvZ
VAPGITVLGDAVELRRVFINLLENALRYARSDGTARVDVAAEVQAQKVIVTLRDHGPGVPAEQLPRLIQPFFRGDAARTTASGSGLGLSIVNKAVARMGGQLMLRNHAQGGLVAELVLQRG